MIKNDLELNCCISNSNQAFIAFYFEDSPQDCNSGIYVINGHKNNDVSVIFHSIKRFLLSKTIVHKSYLIGASLGTLVAVDVNSGKRCAEFYSLGSVFNITTHYNTGTVALVTDGGWGIKFLKLNVPE